MKQKAAKISRYNQMPVRYVIQIFSFVSFCVGKLFKLFCKFQAFYPNFVFKKLKNVFLPLDLVPDPYT